MVQEIKSYDEFKALISGDKIVVVDFWATWCGPCKLIAPHFVKSSTKEEYANLVFAKVDVEEVPEVAQEVGIKAMPTFAAFKGGEKIDSIVGAQPAKLIELLNKCSA